MPEAITLDQQQPGTAETRTAPSQTPMWMLSGSSIALLLLGWLLPWFVEPIASGVGFSPQDAVAGFVGPESIALWIVGIAFVVLLLGLGADVLDTVRHRTAAAADASRSVAPWRRLTSPRTRTVLALLGAASTVLIWIVVESQTSGQRRLVPTLFGQLDKNAVADNAVWLTLSGFVIAAFAFGCREFVLRHATVSLAGVAFAFGALVPLIFSGPSSQEFIDFAAGSVAVYTLLALGLNVVVGFAGLLDLGYAAFFAIGAYTCAWLTGTQHGLLTYDGHPDFIIPFWVVLFLGASVAMWFGAVLGAPTLRLRGDYLAIVTLGFGEIVPDLARNDTLNQTGGPNGLTGIPHPTLNILEIGIAVLIPAVVMLVALRRWETPMTRLRTAGRGVFGLVGAVGVAIMLAGAVQLATGRAWTLDFGIDPRPYYWSLLFVIGLVIIALRNLERSRMGRAWVAIREDEVAAAATGINTVTTKLLAFGIGATVSGFAGAFFGAQLGLITPESFGFQVSVTALTTVVLGGIGNIGGVALGAVVVTFVIFWILPHAHGWAQTLSTTTGVSSLGDFDFSKYTYVVYGLILISIMLLRPSGLLPSAARKVELEQGGEAEGLAAVQGRA